MKNQPRTLKNHENPPETMKNQPGTMKNHENQPGTMKNQPGAMKNHENRPGTMIYLNLRLIEHSLNIIIVLEYHCLCI